jgi:hypothetical protein
MSTVYRIRYRAPDDAEEAEAVIEANSPAEALVKFRHGCDVSRDALARQEVVTSVCPDRLGEAPLW